MTLIATSKAPRLSAQSFALYYGYGPLSELAGFDFVILEPAGWSAAQLASLDAAGVRRFAYLSVMEASEQSYYRARLTREDLLHAGGRPWYRDPFGTWVVDPRSTRWRAHLRLQIAALIAAGWHGVLLDTAGDVEDVRVEPFAHWLLPATADLVRFIRAALGERVLLQNSGLFRLLPLTAPLLDGICWEGGPIGAEHADRTVRLGWEALLGASALYGLLPMLLANIPPGPHESTQLGAFAALGQQYSCLTYAAPGDYISGVRLPDGTIARSRR